MLSPSRVQQRDGKRKNTAHCNNANPPISDALNLVSSIANELYLSMESKGMYCTAVFNTFYQCTKINELSVNHPLPPGSYAYELY